MTDTIDQLVNKIREFAAEHPDFVHGSEPDCVLGRALAELGLHDLRTPRKWGCVTAVLDHLGVEYADPRGTWCYAVHAAQDSDETLAASVAYADKDKDNA